ncbi:MAG: alpha/beta hydrolase [Chloroflexota bacterium]
MVSDLQTTNLNGLKVAYRVQGDGRDVLMIHGWASSGRMWQSLMGALVPGFRCWALDLPGFGDSDKPTNGWYSIQSYVELARDFMAARGLRQPDVIGHSMGGMIALSLAAESPDAMRRLVAINPVVTGRMPLGRLLSETPLSRHLLGLGKWMWPLTTSDVFGWWPGQNLAAHVKRTREEWGQTPSAAAMSTLKAMSRHDLSERLPRIAAPTLIILGSRDFTAPNAEGRLAARRIPGAKLAVLRAGHLPTDDAPEETNALIDGFLAANLRRNDSG